MHNPIIPAMMAASLQCAAMFPLGAAALAQDRTASPLVLTDIVTVKGTIDSVDRGARTVILRTEDGHVLPVRVDPTVSTFVALAAGDRVTMDFLLATAVSIASAEAASGSAQTAPSGAAAATVAPRDKPAGVVAATALVTATIDEIDYATRRAKVRGEQGGLQTIRIGDAIGNIERFRKGDTVAIRHTEPVAISVSK